jgi:flagellar basal body L-ring protein FlgH
MRIVFPMGLAFLVLFGLSGCADMINSLREESAAIDREADSDRSSDEVADYQPRTRLREEDSGRAGRGFGRRLASFSSDTEGGGSFEGERTGSPPPSYRRVSRHDFVDNDANENSLWDAQGQTNFLFSHNRNRDLGDLVTADVEKELKREIQYQLWMTLPPEQRRPKRTPASAKGDAAKPAETAAAGDKAGEEKNKDAAEEAAKTNMASGGKDDDSVRMEIAENLGNGLVRVVGQKRVIYRGVARVVEVVALVSGKDIDDSNRVKSSAFIDMKTQVIQ